MACYNGIFFEEKTTQNYLFLYFLDEQLIDFVLSIFGLSRHAHGLFMTNQLQKK